MIEKLNVKYKNDQLTVEELNQLREELQQCSEADLSAYLEHSWMNDDYDLSCADEQKLLQLKDKLDLKIRFYASEEASSQTKLQPSMKINSAGQNHQLSNAEYNKQNTEQHTNQITERNTIQNNDFSTDKNKQLKRVWLKWAQLAASFLLPVFMILSFFLYDENKMLVSEQIQVATAAGEKVTISLPDGTVVMMNSSSTLSYQPNGFTTKERVVNFKGEAFFQVKKDKTPFKIYAKDLVVEVLGTTFNLDAREDTPTAALTLETGRVKFLAVNIGKSVILQPNQRVVLNRMSGKMNIYKVHDTDTYTAWKKQEMVFRNTKFATLLQTIEQNYSVNFIMDQKSNIADSDLFNGTLSTSNLNEVMDVIEKVYHLRAEIVGDTIYLSRK